jgi:hypothetical protein
MFCEAARLCGGLVDVEDVPDGSSLDRFDVLRIDVLV